VHSKMYFISSRTQLTAPNCQPVGKTCVDCTHKMRNKSARERGDCGDAEPSARVQHGGGGGQVCGKVSWQQYELTCRLSFRPHVYSTLPGLGRPRPSLRTTLASFPQAATNKITSIIPVFTSIPVSNLATMLAPRPESNRGTMMITGFYS
jgi:hypothetical protein